MLIASKNRAYQIYNIRMVYHNKSTVIFFYKLIGVIVIIGIIFSVIFYLWKSINDKHFILIDIADKYNVSLDWLAGRIDYTFDLSSMRDFVLFMYELAMKKEIGFKIIAEDKFPNNDIKTEENK